MKESAPSHSTHLKLPAQLQTEIPSRIDGERSEEEVYVGVEHLHCRGLRIQHAQDRAYTEQAHRRVVPSLPTEHHLRDGRVRSPLPPPPPPQIKNAAGKNTCICLGTASCT